MNSTITVMTDLLSVQTRVELLGRMNLLLLLAGPDTNWRSTLSKLLLIEQALKLLIGALLAGARLEAVVQGRE